MRTAVDKTAYLVIAPNDEATQWPIAGAHGKPACTGLTQIVQPADDPLHINLARATHARR
jgi:hypothetical protein